MPCNQPSVIQGLGNTPFMASYSFLVEAFRIEAKRFFLVALHGRHIANVGQRSGYTQLVIRLFGEM